MTGAFGNHDRIRPEPKKGFHGPSHDEGMGIDMIGARTGFDEIGLEQDSFVFDLCWSDAQFAKHRER